MEVASGTAIWYHTGKPPVSIRYVLVRDPDGDFDPQALLATDLEADPRQIIEWFVLRWRLEVTFQEVRLHLGVETQRQWSDLAIARITPILFGLFSIVTLATHNLYQDEAFSPRSAAWYCKPLPTFSDAWQRFENVCGAVQGFLVGPLEAVRLKKRPCLYSTAW